MKCPVINLDNKSAGDIDLNDKIFCLPIRNDILHRMVSWQLAKRRSGNHKTKQRSEVLAAHAQYLSGERALPYCLGLLIAALSCGYQSGVWLTANSPFGEEYRS
jgi:hypothetical protein